MHEQPSIMNEQGQEEEDYWRNRWIDCVRFYDDTKHLDHPFRAELVYVNLRRCMLWPAPMHMRNCGTMNLLASQLEYSATVPIALHVIRHELVAFGHYPLQCIASTMASGIWRLMVARCDESLTYAGNATHEEALVALVQPITNILACLGIKDLVNVCWHLDWPSRRS